jgi:hypothetical protein
MDSRPQREIHSPKPFSQPRPPRALRQINELGVNDLFDRRIPAQTDFPGTSGPDVEAPRGNNGELQSSVINLDDIDAFLPAACQLVLFNAPCSLAEEISGVY